MRFAGRATKQSCFKSEQNKIMKTLSGHTTPETAFIVDDYPYGFRLRCRIRYWLEYKPGKGFRLWSQTTNPKRGNNWSNKPKASTFSWLGGVMFTTDDGHVHWDGLSQYNDVKDCVKFLENYGHTMPQAAQDFLKLWISKKLSFEQAKAEGQVTCTITTTQYGSITAPDFGKPIAPVEVKSEVLTSDYTPAELLEMGQAIRADKQSEINKFAVA